MALVGALTAAMDRVLKGDMIVDIIKSRKMSQEYISLSQWREKRPRKDVQNVEVLRNIIKEMQKKYQLCLPVPSQVFVGCDDLSIRLRIPDQTTGKPHTSYQEQRNKIYCTRVKSNEKLNVGLASFVVFLVSGHQQSYEYSPTVQRLKDSHLLKLYMNLHSLYYDVLPRSFRLVQDEYQALKGREQFNSPTKSKEGSMKQDFKTIHASAVDCHHKQYQEAGTLYKKALTRAFNNSQKELCYQNLARLCLDQKLYKECEDVLGEANKCFKGLNQNMTEMQADCYCQAKYTGYKGISLYLQLAKFSKNKIGLFLKAALECYKTQYTQRAQTYFQKVIQIYQETKGKSEATSKSVTEKRTLSQYQQVDRIYIVANLNLAAIKESKSDLEGAKALYLSLLALCPNLGLFAKAYGYFLIQTKKYAEAKQQFISALSILKTDYQVLWNLSYCFLQLDSPECLTYLSKCKANSPQFKPLINKQIITVSEYLQKLPQFKAQPEKLQEWNQLIKEARD